MSPARMSRLDVTMRVVLEFHEALNQRDKNRMIRLVAANCLFEFSDGVSSVGVDAVSHLWEGVFKNTSHGHFEIEEIFSFGERCIRRWQFHSDSADDLTPAIRGVDIFRVRGGLICELLSYSKA